MSKEGNSSSRVLVLHQGKDRTKKKGSPLNLAIKEAKGKRS